MNKNQSASGKSCIPSSLKDDEMAPVQSVSTNSQQQDQYQQQAQLSSRLSSSSTSSVSSSSLACRSHQRRPSGTMLGVGRKAVVSGLVCLILAVFLLSPPSNNQLAECAKIKKAVKSIAKGLIFQSLSTKKNFLPLPVPIPGKWQQLLNTMIDSGLLNHKGLKAAAAVSSASSLVARVSSAKISNQNNKFSSLSSDSTGKKLLLFGASNLVDELSNNNKKLNKLLSGGQSSSSPSSAVDVNNIKKLTRSAAAKYARYIISNQVGKTQNNNNKSSPKSFSGGPASFLKKSGHSHSDRGSKRNDVLVTAFNVVKLAQQIREMDPTKFLSLSKKSSLMSPASYSSSAVHHTHHASPGLLSMNIDNKKTWLNKMHYFHKLTYDLHHRHRRNHGNTMKV